jgi:predicted RNase H-like HicB family nuclease
MKTAKRKQAPEKTYPFIVEWTKTGFSAYSKDHAVATTGETLNELRRNAAEALGLLLDTPRKKVTAKQIHFFMDMRYFFKQYRVLNARQLAHRIDMNHTLLSQYVSGAKMPSEEQTERILVGIRKLAKELAGVSLTAQH